MSCRLGLLVSFLLPLSAITTQAAEPQTARSWRGIDVAGMDKSAKPWEDFYQFANGKWLAETDVPADRSAIFVFTLLEDRNRAILHDITEEAAKDTKADPQSIRGKVGAFYRSGMDEASIEAAGVQPLRDEFARIDAIRDKASLLQSLARLHTLRAFAGFLFTSTPDAKNSKRMIAEFWQGGLALPDRDYYLKDDDKTKATRTAYVEHVRKMLALTGEQPDAAAQHAQSILAFETRLARASKPRVELRDPQRNYHLLSVAEMEQETPAVDWKPYFAALGLGELKELNVGQPDFLKEVGKMLQDVTLDDWKAYLRWQLLNTYADKLSTAFMAEDFHFNQTILNGTPKDRPRWERSVMATDRMLGEALGQLYVERAFPPEAKAKAEALVKNVKATLRERLAGLDWMSPATRIEALKKLDAIRLKIGYPSKWRDYSGLSVAHSTFAANAIAANVFKTQYDLAKIGKPTDPEEWSMTPPTVNAYYSSSRNEIVFPAGILQPPFFDSAADDAVNYGAMGLVIGHELTHGFDDQGRKFDAAGNLRDWWLPQDEITYKERAARISDQYAGYLAVDDLKVNGQLTLGENIADLGGLKIAYLTLQKSLEGKPAVKVDGFTPQQRFFLSFAQIWRCQMRPEMARVRVRVDPHSPPRWRVLGPLYNTPEFFQAFDIRAEDAKGRVNPRPVQIW